jgi:metal-responsive CopG/Arc/MetJ family transcriptional regulator
MTISLPAALRRQVARSAKARHLTQSEFVRAALQEKLWEDAVESSARMLAPKARALGLLTDEDVFKTFS